MDSEKPAVSDESQQSRWQLAGDVLKFQAKLFIDGLRDLLMSPISLLAALAGILFEPTTPRRLFDRVLEFGRQTESWINLFGRQTSEPGVDDLFGALEDRLKHQVEQGGMTATAKEKIDASLDRLHERVASRPAETADADKPGDQ